MKRRPCQGCVAFLTLLLVWSGCAKKEDGDAQKGAGPAPVSAEEIAAVRNALAKGLQPVGLANIKSSDVGRQCLVEVRTPEGGVQIAPPPPPPGMVRMVGQVTFYQGELDGVTPESLTVRKAYPTSGNFKKLEIPRADIQSIHLAP
ncbi:MAG TPA: hypothetical protein PLU87_15515 [Sedimentisphaerales bacterium]|nr:hypothetical protein [Sedimentisphaerales bacterium]HRS12517.1 hypothetical protein [Sedimentisphaerales bacterium]HRV49155.1 hypothetical protein [Sedimentisphaerales bacterium]